MPVSFDHSTISRVQQASDIIEVISEHLTLHKRGKEFVGLCPFHSDHRPSMYVNPEKQIFKCFACGAGGDVIKFVQMREQLTFVQAVKRLAERRGIRLPSPRQRRREGSENAAQGDPAMIARVNAWAQKFFVQSLFAEQGGSAARNYVASRGIDEETMKAWGLGLAPDGWDNLLKAARVRGISDALLLQSGLVVSRDDGSLYDKFRNRLMFPIVDVTNRVIGFGGRTLGSDPAKYMNTPATVLFDKSHSLFGLDKARQAIGIDGTAVVVEGYTDAIMAHQAGCANVVATLGTSFTEGHARVLRRYAKRIVLVFDSDVAGMEAANRALEVCLSQRIDIKLAFVTEGKDPCDYILSEGGEAFVRLVQSATDVMEYKWQRLELGLAGSDTLADRRRIMEDYLRTVATAMASGTRDPIAEGLIGTKLSRIIGLGEAETVRLLARLARQAGRGAGVNVPNQKVAVVTANPRQAVQREVLEVLLCRPELLNEVRDRIDITDFDEGPLREIAKAIAEALDGQETATIADVLVCIESERAAAIAVELEQSGSAKGNFAARLADAVGVLEGRRLEIKKAELKRRLSDDDENNLLKVAELIVQRKRGQRTPGLMRR
ncbi:MAG TPA: DNA primase [Anaerohalosphaeraceae bacterium]|nr:DNA primase [Anaerohalosphaeraceae bacterium]HRT51703.1 DNA primase [Anaerohalosphaeraceae bacterium]HRT87719.1 DNA primase [Anaerohalosphaeraceae bacterium]